MALSAVAAVPSADVDTRWPWHKAKWCEVRARVMWRGDRRMEGETYLSSGYGLRTAIQEREAGWKPLRQLASVWQPSRLKGIQVSPNFGTPFLAATQVFDILPVPRKWLALERTGNAAGRFVRSGTILVTCSGLVGRATVAYAPHVQALITHDLLRVVPLEKAMAGWIYGYLRSPQARAITVGTHYGHIIKHLEAAHLDELPVPVVKEGIAVRFGAKLEEILELRNKSHTLALDAEAEFEKALGCLQVPDRGERGFEVRASGTIFGGRRRLDAARHNPGATAIWRHLARNGCGFLRIGEAGYRVWVPGRYKRIPADDGVPYWDSADLFEVCPDVEKRFADCRFGDKFRGRVDDGWLLVASSGQVYGIIGSVVMAGPSLKGQVVSNHVIRIAAGRDPKVRGGYLLTALGHPQLGRPLVKAMAFGSSVPEIDLDDLNSFEVVRLGSRVEDRIADLAEEATGKRAKADLFERELSTEAGELIERFIAGDMRDFVP